MTWWPSSAIAAAWGAPRWPQPITDTRMPVLLVRGQWVGGAHRMRCAPVKLQSVTGGGGGFPRNGDAEPEDPSFPGWLRQRIEAVVWTLKNQLGLERHAARTTEG